MSWLYSQALVAAYSAANCSAGEQSAPSSGTPTPLLYCVPDRMTEFSRLSRFGMTFKPSTELNGEAVLTWFLAVFPARIYQSRARELESKAPEAECGFTCHESLAKYDPNSRSWRTRQRLLFEDSDESLVIWPRWGMMRAGECWAQSMPENFICERESGLWPTPCATDHKGSRAPQALADAGRNERNNLRDFMRAKGQWLYPPVRITESMMAFPQDWTDCAASGTDKFRQWLHSHGKYSAHDKTP
jgi:hypothetical protein